MRATFLLALCANQLRKNADARTALWEQLRKMGVGAFARIDIPGKPATHWQELMADPIAAIGGDLPEGGRFLARRVRFSGPLPECTAVAFVDGPTWAVEHTTDKTTDFWLVECARDLVLTHIAPDSVLRRDTDVRSETARLRGALGNAIEFCAAEHLTEWCSHFVNAQDQLDAQAPPRSENPLLICLPAPAQRLFAAANSAWCFGGMGAFNDLSYPPNHRFHNVADNLYTAICDSAAAAVNTSAST